MNIKEYLSLKDAVLFDFLNDDANDKISGETLNSQNTTLCTLYKMCLESLDEKKEREAIETSNQKVSIRYILSRYAKNKVQMVSKLDSISGLRRMIAILYYFQMDVILREVQELPKIII